MIEMLKSIGLMSGTSMDGIDAALLETDGAHEIKELGHVSISYDPNFRILLKAAEYAIRKCTDVNKAKNYYAQALHEYLINELKILEIHVPIKIKELSIYFHQADKPITLAEVIQRSTELHGDAVTRLLIETGYKKEQIDVIGYHGQTMLHRPADKISIIVGDGQALANRLGITVVNDFRSQDIAANGQGAPFAPLYHQALAIRDQKTPAAIINCGGIANITLIQNANEDDLIAFDTGPGNGLIDKLIRQLTSGKEQMDKDGHYGKNGKIDKKVLEKLYEKSIIKNNQNYFSMPFPKSLDINDMQLVPELDELSLEDACRTLEAFTADTIVKSLEFLNITLPTHWILAGGGWKNPVICEELKARLTQKLGNKIQISTADEIGWNSQAIEAQVFAYLAVRSLQKKPLSVPGTTGAPEPLTGGHTYFPPQGETKIVKELLEKNSTLLFSYQT